MNSITEFERFIEMLEDMECPYHKVDTDLIVVGGATFAFGKYGKFVSVGDPEGVSTKERGAGYA